MLTLLAFGSMPMSSAGWQRDVHVLVGLEPPSGASPLFVVALTVAVALALVGVARFLRAAARRVARPMARALPDRLAGALGALLVAAGIGAALDQVVLRWALTTVSESFDAVNNEVPAGREPPTTGLRSGGPGSLSAWEDLGVQRRAFVSAGPRPADLAETAAGRQVVQPIRIHAGAGHE